MILKGNGKCLNRISGIPDSFRVKHSLPVCVCESKTEVTDLPAKPARILKAVYWPVITAIYMFFLNERIVYAADIWSTFSAMMKDIYTKLLGISTIVAVTAAAVALLIRMISRNQRAVDEASSWLKRILVTWIILNTLGFIVAYIQPLVAGGQYTP